MVHRITSLSWVVPRALIPRVWTHSSTAPILAKADSQEIVRLTNAVLRPQINRATQENYRPGSIFKIVTGLACLEAGMDPEEIIHCNGDIWIGRRRIDDLAPAEASRQGFRRGLQRDR